MAMEMNRKSRHKFVIKLSVSYADKRNLAEIDPNNNLEEIIAKICKSFNVSNPKKYDLKLLEALDGTRVNCYIDADNLDIISDGVNLELTEALNDKIDTLLKNHVSQHDSVDGINDDVTELYNLSNDPVFIKRLLKQEKHKIIVNHLIETQTSENHTILTDLKILLEILKQKAAIEIEDKILEKLIHIVISSQHLKTLNAALAVLGQIMIMKSKQFDKPKQIIVQELDFNKLIKCMQPIAKYPNAEFLNINILVLINRITRLLKGELKINYVRQMNNREHKNIIYTCCIDKSNNKQTKAIPADLVRALSQYQKLALVNMHTKLSTYCDRPQQNEDDVQSYRNSIISIDETPEELENEKEKWMPTMHDSNTKSRISFLSVASTESASTFLSDDDVLIGNKITNLTKDCLEYFKENHYKNYITSIGEDKHFGIDFFQTAETMTKILTKIFGIGHTTAKSDFFYPIFFRGALSGFFFQELYSRAFWLFSKTKREMRISMKHDYHVAFKVLTFQLESILKTRPHDYEQLMSEMKKSSHTKAFNTMNKEAMYELKYSIQTNPVFQDVRRELEKQNIAIICEQRINTLLRGDVFPKFGPKKGGKMFVKLNGMKNMITWGDWDEINSRFIDTNTFMIKDIQHVIIGEACPHVKDNRVKKQDQHCAFTIALGCETMINFLAYNEVVAHYWTDCLHILMQSNIRSKTFEKDLSVLLEMDMNLKLLELQNKKIPSRPPIVPPYPTNLPDETSV